MRCTNLIAEATLSDFVVLLGDYWLGRTNQSREMVEVNTTSIPKTKREDTKKDGIQKPSLSKAGILG